MCASETGSKQRTRGRRNLGTCTELGSEGSFNMVVHVLRPWQSDVVVCTTPSAQLFIR